MYKDICCSPDKEELNNRGSDWAEAGREEAVSTNSGTSLVATVTVFDEAKEVA